jgi:PAS domain S-box-containing protein
LEKAFDSNQALLQALAVISPVGIFQTDSAGYCTYVNNRWCEITGLSPEQAHGTGWATALHPDDRERVRNEWYGAAQTKGIFRSKYRFLRPDGIVTWVFGQAVCYENPGGEVAGYIGTVTDITEIKENEQELRNAKEQYQLLFERNPLPGWVFDVETLAFLEVNQAAINHYEYSREEFLAMTLNDIRLPGEIPRLRESLKHLPAGLKRAGVWSHKKKDGSLIEVEIFNYDVQFRGRPARLALAIDVTERKYYEERLKENARLAALAETATIFAHEVANPLNGISTSFQILLRGNQIQDPRHRELLEDAAKEIQRLNELLQDFRTFARPEVINPRPLNLRNLIREVLSMETLDYSARGIQVKQEFTPGCPRLAADGPKLKQVFLNLFRNAVEAMPDGGTLKVRGYDCDRGVAIEVTDTGKGIPGGINIFDAFATTKPGGTGLGLAIVKKIVSAHGGTITYQSKARFGAERKMSGARYDSSSSILRYSRSSLCQSSSRTIRSRSLKVVSASSMASVVPSRFSN